MKDEILKEIIEELFGIENVDLSIVQGWEISTNDLRQFSEIIIDKCQQIIIESDNSGKNKNLHDNIIKNIDVLNLVIVGKSPIDLSMLNALVKEEARKKTHVTLNEIMQYHILINHKQLTYSLIDYM